MKDKIAITGSRGVIGTVLRKGLADKYHVTSIELPAIDVRDYVKLVSAFVGHAAVIHLAWDTDVDNFQSGRINSANSIMFENVYRAAVEAKVPLVMMASSVHADRFYQDSGIKKTDTLPTPDSPYGAHKVFMERLGKWYADEKELGVVCIRFGGINEQDKPWEVKDSNNIVQKSERAVWLSHKDCVSFVEKCLSSDFKGFAVVYLISNNENLIHDLSNPFGWTPQDGGRSDY